MKQSLGRIVRVIVYLVVLIAPVVAYTVIATNAARTGRYTPQPVLASSELPAPPPHDSAKPTAVVVVSTLGAQVSDLLDPYTVLAATGAFNLYTVGPERQVVPMSAGLGMIPHLTFAELAQRLGDEAPAVVVVPDLPDVGSAGHQPVADWLRSPDLASSIIVSVCNGSVTLADAGLLDGRQATAHWSALGTWEGRYPNTEWLRGQRYVDDGNVVTAAGVTSGFDGTLHVVAKILGEEAAAEAARAIGYPHLELSLSPEIPASRLEPTEDIIFPVNAAFGWDRPTIGAVLATGVDELEVAALADAYSGQAFAANVVTVAPAREAVRSARGVDLVPLYDLASAPALDRLVVLGDGEAEPAVATWAQERGLEPEALFAASDQFPYDAVLTDMARYVNEPSARVAAKLLEWPAAPDYPGATLQLSGAGWPWGLLLRPVAMGLILLALVVALDRGVINRRQRAKTNLDDAPPVAQPSPSSPV